MAMVKILRRPSTFIGIAAAIIVTVSLFLFAPTKATVSDPENMISMTVTGSITFYTPEGEGIVTSPMQALYAEGRPIESANATVGYQCSGREIRWDTLQVTITAVRTLYKPAEDTFLIDEIFLNETFGDKKNALTVTLNFTEMIIPFVPELANETKLEFTVKFILVASALDRYGVPRTTAPYRVRSTVVTTWVEPSLTISTDQPSSAVDAYDAGYDAGYSDGWIKGGEDGYYGRDYNPTPPTIPSPPAEYSTGSAAEEWTKGYTDGYEDGYAKGYIFGQKQSRLRLQTLSPITMSLNPFAITFLQAPSVRAMTYIIAGIASGIMAWFLTKRFLGL